MKKDIITHQPQLGFTSTEQRDLAFLVKSISPVVTKKYKELLEKVLKVAEGNTQPFYKPIDFKKNKPQKITKEMAYQHFLNK